MYRRVASILVFVLVLGWGLAWGSKDHDHSGIYYQVDFQCNKDKAGEVEGVAWIEFFRHEERVATELIECAAPSADWIYVRTHGVVDRIEVESWLFTDKPVGIELCHGISEKILGEGVQKMRVECWSPHEGQSKDCSVLTIGVRR
jgi:hypothetical protein